MQPAGVSKSLTRSARSRRNDHDFCIDPNKRIGVASKRSPNSICVPPGVCLGRSQPLYLMVVRNTNEHKAAVTLIRHP